MASTLSKSDQVERALLELVAHHRRRQDEPLPTELVLAERLSVSRMTLRKAMRRLVLDGVVVRKQGSGTFLTPDGAAKSRSKQEFSAAASVRPFSVGVAFPTFTDDYFQRIADTCEHELAANGVTSVFLKARQGASFLDQVLDLYRQGVDGIVLNAADTGFSARLREAAPGLRAVFVNEIVEGEDSVTSDDGDGAAQVVRYLVSLGHKRIAHLHMALDTTTGQARLEGYRQAMRECGLEEDIRVAEATLGRNGMWDLLKDGPPPEAVFCANDYSAQVARETLREAGLKVPEDVSLVGYGNVRCGMEMSPPLSSVDQHPALIGSIAADILLKRLRGFQLERRLTLVPTSIVFRGSCAPRMATLNGGKP